MLEQLRERGTILRRRNLRRSSRVGSNSTIALQYMFKRAPAGKTALQSALPPGYRHGYARRGRLDHSLFSDSVIRFRIDSYLLALQRYWRQLGVENACERRQEGASRSSAPASPACPRPGCCASGMTSPSSSARRRLGGHSNTVTVDQPSGHVAVDTGFIVYNEATYPNLDGAVRASRRATTQPSEMSFAVSLRRRRARIFRHRVSAGLFAQKRNLAQPALLVDAARPASASTGTAAGRRRNAAGVASRSATISTPGATAPPSATITCCRWRPRSGRRRARRSSTIRPRLHPLLRQSRPAEADATGRSGARSTAAAAPMSRSWRGAFADACGSDADLQPISARTTAWCHDPRRHGAERFDHVVIATHADQALALLADPTRRGTRAARRLPLQPQPRGAAYRRQR